MCYVYGVDFSQLAPNQFLPKAKTAATTALEIDDSLAQAHASRALVAMVLDRDWPSAEKEIRRAIELNPNDPSAHLTAMRYLDAMGKPAKATEEGEKALKLDSYSSPCNSLVSWHLSKGRQYNRALALAQGLRALGVPSEEVDAFIGMLHTFQGRYDLAIGELQGSVSAPSPNPAPVAMLAYAYAAEGKRPQAERLLEELEEQSKRRYVSRYLLAIVYTGLKNKDRAMACLEEAYDEHSPWVMDVTLDPLLDPLHSDPRFQDLMRRLGLPQSR